LTARLDVDPMHAPRVADTRPRRIVLKMSGEALASSASDETIDAAVVERLAKEIANARAELELELAIVVGGGTSGEA